MTTQELQAELDRLDDGILRHGSHPAGGREFCALEFESQVRGRAWSDDPITLPDLRRLNDARWSSDAARTAALLPVMSALWGWATWTPTRRQTWATRVAIDTVRQIIAELPTLPDAVRDRCRTVTTLQEARDAAHAAYAAADAASAASAASAADAADAAAAAAAAAHAAHAAYAASAASASAASAAYAAAYAAYAYAYAAASAAYAYAAAVADTVLRRVCQIWIDAAQEGQA